ncbi:ureidoglycolate lyase [Alkalihalobacillus oceani]|uniref:ureidoglycolate lyase n=1 Tax=Halalkalibacter oceani TaxID=1653776 RepID=UPI00203B2FB4|nr:ureidoglycolate lyase [Halalkalibacter oceani]MCM3762967.1 ureidoglycolate lyase [Halalkalibacter oceani]
MMETIQVEPLTASSFEPYGRCFEIPDAPPSKEGEGWDCWSYLANMEATTRVGVGMVRTQKRELIVDSMERHVSREEILLPLYDEIIQPVGLYRDLADPDEAPEIQTVKCFLLKPGQGIIIGKGIWHSPAYPVNRDTDYLFMIENKKDAFGDEMINPWEKFIGERKFKMRV